MQFNVASLLKGPVGESQRHQVDEASFDWDDVQVAHVWGQVSLTRLNEGIWVRGAFRATVDCTCSRCLQSFQATLRIPFNETYYPTLDINSGAPVTLPEDAEADATIDDHHTLDIAETLRQDIILAVPMKPLCKPDCAGICPQCGKDLNQATCRCPQETIDPRLTPLLSFLSQQKN